MTYLLIIHVFLLFVYTLVITRLFNRIFSLPVSVFKFGAIEGLRGVLAFSVFIHHLVIWFFHLKKGCWGDTEIVVFDFFGRAGVSIFFIITGFLFTNRLLNETAINWKHFFINRFLRLGPLYLFSISLLIFIVLCLTKFHFNESFKDFAYGSAKWLLFTYMGSTSLNGLAETHMINAGVAWTLAYEWFFYFSLPVFGFIFFRKKTPAIVLVFCVALCVLFVLKRNLRYSECFHFLAGGMVALVINLLKDKARFFKHFSFSVLIAVLAGLNVYFFNKTPAFIFIILNTVIFLIIAGGNNFFGLLDLKASQLLGQLSYGLYILHGIVLFLFNSVIFKKEFLVDLDLTQYLNLGLLYITILIIITYLTRKYIEIPFMKYKAQD